MRSTTFGGSLSDDALDRLAELIPIGIIRTDPEGRCLHVNGRWTRLTGLDRESALGSGWLEVVDAVERERVRARWSGTSAEAGEFAEEFTLRTTAGEPRMVSSRVVPLFGPDGVYRGRLAALTDVTERHRTEEALRRTARELRARVKELACLFGIARIVERTGGALPDVLREVASLLPGSWEHSDIACARIALDGLDFRTTGFRDTIWRQAAEVRVQGVSAGLIEVYYMEERPEADEGPFLREERDLIEAVADVLGQIAERARSERILRERERDLRERLTHLTRVGVLGEMASSIAHEVSQPLTAVATYAQACKRLLASGSAEGGQVAEILDRIAGEALRAGDIVQRLRELVRRRETGRAKLDLNELIRDVERLASVDARLHDVRLRLELTPDLPAVWADGVQLQQVVLNLIRNGIDAMEETPVQERELVVRTFGEDAGGLGVSVADRGCGLPAGIEENLFQSFFTTKQGGMGMGLSISRTIVEAHGGRMWFSRNPGRGVTFGFSIPAAAGGGDVGE